MRWTWKSRHLMDSISTVRSFFCCSQAKLFWLVGEKMLEGKCQAKVLWFYYELKNWIKLVVHDFMCFTAILCPQLAWPFCSFFFRLPAIFELHFFCCAIDRGIIIQLTHAHEMCVSVTYILPNCRKCLKSHLLSRKGVRQTLASLSKINSNCKSMCMASKIPPKNNGNLGSDCNLACICFFCLTYLAFYQLV